MNEIKERSSVITIIHRIENDTAIVEVPLTNSDKVVRLYQETFDELIAKKLSPVWKLVRGQILEVGSNLSVTRLAADAKAGHKVRLLDKEPTNLRRDNLAITSGMSNAKDKLKERTHNFNPVTIKHQYINPQHISILGTIT
jgi:hypothetical protein